MTRTEPHRRQDLLAGAARAFARGGYFGTSMAEIAQEAGVSQPRISQVFGSKEALFVETHRYAGRAVIDALDAVAGRPFDARRLGGGYAAIMSGTPELLMVITHGFSGARIPAIAAESRRLFAEVYDVVTTQAGASTAEAAAFISRGFLIHIALLADLPRHLDEHPQLAELTAFLLPGARADAPEQTSATSHGKAS